jgi:hypothetical protein
LDGSAGREPTAPDAHGANDRARAASPHRRALRAWDHFDDGDELAAPMSCVEQPRDTWRELPSEDLQYIGAGIGRGWLDTGETPPPFRGARRFARRDVTSRMHVSLVAPHRFRPRNGDVGASAFQAAGGVFSGCSERSRTKWP